MKITFLGATGQVTGSMYYIEDETFKGLIDCGQFQGTLDEEEQNYADLPFEASDLDFIILTHAHIDHTGRLPLLVKKGFHGKVYCTYPTMALSKIMLKDSGKIHEAENAYDNKKRLRAGLEKIAPLYTEDDAIEALQYLYPIPYKKNTIVRENLSFHFIDAGHLLGSSSIVLTYTDSGETKTISFSGDLGNSSNALLNPPDTIDHSHIVIMESTYGNREHKGIDQRMTELVNIIRQVSQTKGTIIIPSFAVGRTQEVIYYFNDFLATCDDETKSLILNMPIYVDSPMALEAFKVYKEHISYLSKSVQDFDGDAFNLPNLHLVESIEGSIMLNKLKGPKMIISASGMCDAGRIKHHLKHNLWKDNTHVVFIGYQAEESLGRAILEGQSPLTIFDETIAVKAKIHKVTGFSGHADEKHLLNWIKAIRDKQKIFIVHGEPDVMEDFADTLTHVLDPNAEIIIPGPYETFEL